MLRRLLVSLALVFGTLGPLAAALAAADVRRLAPQSAALAKADASVGVPPLGISPQMMQMAQPSGEPASPAQVALGERLFFDKRLSVNDTVSCATCHEPARGFVDHQEVSDGVDGKKGQRNTPTVLNAMFHKAQFWDGRAATLEEQAKLPILDPVEMGQKDGAAVAAKIASIDTYAKDFVASYGEVSFDNIAHAIAAYERTQASGNAPFDRYIAGDAQALDAAQKRGWALFNGKARCNECHAYNRVSALFSDQQFHNIGISAHKQNFTKLAQKAEAVVQGADAQKIDELALQTAYSELGRFMVTRKHHDIGAFKTQTLRNIGITAPYMHDGSLPTLWDVIDHYNRGGIQNAYLDGGIARLGLREAEIDDLVAFLFALTDVRYQNLNAAEFKLQNQLRQVARPQRNTAAAMGQAGDFGDVGADAAAKNPADIGAF